MPWAGVEFCGEGMHLHCRVFAEMKRGAAGEAIGVRPEMSKQEGMDTGNPLPARLRVREHIVAHGHFTCAEQVFKLYIGIGEFPERRFDDTACRVGSEAHQDNTEGPGGPQSQGVRLNLGRTFRRQKLRALAHFLASVR